MLASKKWTDCYFGGKQLYKDVKSEMVTTHFIKIKKDWQSFFTKGHNRFSQIPSLIKLLHQGICYFVLSKDMKKSWWNFECIYLKLLSKYLLKPKKSQKEQTYSFWFEFLVQNELFESQYHKNNMGTITSKFYYNLYLPKSIEELRSFWPWDEFWFILLWRGFSEYATNETTLIQSYQI